MLRILDVEGKPLQGSFGDPAWEVRGGGLFFTRDFGGTRNIWRAFPDPRDRSRYPSWRALPVTRFTPPLFASHPAPLPSSRALLVVSNAGRPRAAAQIALLSLINPSLRALTDEPGGASEPAPAPDGSAFAFSALRGKITSVWVQGLKEGGTGNSAPTSQLVASAARRAAWQSASDLLVESTDEAIYRISKPWWPGVPPVRLARGSQISVSRDGSTLVVGGKDAGTPRLYLVSGDGSGLRALGSTEGADAPALSSDGRFLAFAAPLAGQESRALWFLPLEITTAEDEIDPPTVPVSDDSVSGVPDSVSGVPNPVPDPAPTTKSTKNEGKVRVAAPVAQIRGVRGAQRGAILILGTASGQNASATLEIGQGAAPTRWEMRPLALPLLPGAPLFLWNPPAGASGTWSFRLLVVNAGGAAQSVFSLQLPLATRSPAPRDLKPVPRDLKPALGVVKSMPSGGPLPNAVLPDLPAPPSLPRPAPLPRSTPFPRLIPLPPRTPQTGAARPDSSSPFLPGSNPNFPASASLPRPPLSPSPPVSPPREVGSTVFNPSVSNEGAAISARDAATFNVSNTLAEMRAGQAVKVTFWALNRGARVWDTGTSSRSTGAVRLVTRWVKFDGGNRRKWTLQWMKQPVLPGARTRWSFDLTAPAQPGRYKLIYGLVRLPGENWAPPAFNEPQEIWPNEFAAIAFAVVVKP